MSADDMADDKAKKMASAIRLCKSSEDFDLSGYGADQCDKLAAAAFSKPLPLDSMIRLSFTVGGGKKVRQKYNDGLPALWADALKKVGFSEDRGASVDLSCAGTFKFQHNTDTDLKVTHVFPKVDTAAAAAAAAVDVGDEALSPAELLVFSEMPTFQRMIASKTPSLGQRRKALEVIKEARAGLSAIDEKLATMKPLSEDEQHRYDTLDGSVLEEKQAWLSKQLELMIDKGDLTAAEKATVMAQLASKVEQLEVQLASATAEGKAKRAEKLESMLEELRTKCANARDLKPIVRKAKYEAEIKAVTKRLSELEKLENSKQVLPLSEVQKLNAKPKLLEDLQAMKAESSGWFPESA